MKRLPIPQLHGTNPLTFPGVRPDGPVGQFAGLVAIIAAGEAAQP